MEKIWADFAKKTVETFPVVIWQIFLVIAIIVVSSLIIRIGRFIITGVIDRQKKFKFISNEKRLDTISTILVSILRYTVYFVAVITILTSVLNVFDIKTVLAAAGIGGVALGFGAQSLVKDIISGVFILAENQIAVGDIIEISGISGTVEEMELRVVKIRSFNGQLNIISNGDVKNVINHTRGHRMAIVDVKLPYEIQVETAKEVVQLALEMVEKESTTLVEVPQILGVTEFGENYYTLRTIAKTYSGENWANERLIREKILLCTGEANLRLGGLKNICS